MGPDQGRFDPAGPLGWVSKRRFRLTWALDAGQLVAWVVDRDIVQGRIRRITEGWLA
jgi:hypothetical protein